MEEVGDPLVLRQHDVEDLHDEAEGHDPEVDEPAPKVVPEGRRILQLEDANVPNDDIAIQK